MEFRILGPLEVAEGDRLVALGGPRQRALLAVLLLNANDVVASERLIDALWGDSPPATAAKSVQVYVSGLRRALRSGRADDRSQGVLCTRAGGYVVRVEAGALDAHRFEGLLEDGRRALSGGEPERAATALRAALGLWRGGALMDFTYEPFAQHEIARLEELRLAAREELSEAELALGRHRDVVAGLEALVAEHPLRERMRGQLMLALYRSDRQADALDVYRQGRRHLVDVLGLEPSPALQRLEQAILAQSPELDPPPTVRAAPGPPIVDAGPPLPTASAIDDIPASLRLMSRFPFVGRSAELNTLRALMAPTDNEGRRIVLLSGEAGSGKSRLVREFAYEAAVDGALVLHGVCDPLVHPPYAPFGDALDHLVRVLDPEELRLALGAAGGELTRLVPDLGDRVGAVPAPVEGDPDTERHRLHLAVTQLLGSVSQRRRVLLVLEDGQWADAPSLLLLRQLVRAGGNPRVLVVVTFRDTGGDASEMLLETLADLRRSDNVVRLRLSGLSGDEVADFVRRAAEVDGGAGVAELARAIAELTAGNAFLMCELWRELVETQVVEIGDHPIRLTRAMTDIGVPQSVREVVAHRVSRLEPATTEVLELAAMIGSEFAVDLIRRAAGVPERQLRAALDRGVQSAIIDEAPTRRLAYRFTHELVRRALYDGVGGMRRAELHLRVAEALERASDGSGRALTELAYHFAAAEPLNATRRAVKYNLLAARAASAALAFDEAAAQLNTALDLGIDSRLERAEVLVELGAARHRAGKAIDAMDAFTAATDLARGLKNPHVFARAAIGYEEACSRPGIADQGAVELLEEAAAGLGDENSKLRVRLLAGLARALDLRGDRQRAAVVRESAITMARRLGDQAGLATVLVRSYWSRPTTSLPEILDQLAEAAEIGEKLRDAEIRVEALGWRVPALVALCDLDAARTELATMRQAAQQAAQPFKLHVADHFGSAIALCDGRLQEAESMAARSHEWSRLLTGRDPSGIHGIQMFSVRREQGRLAELAPLIRTLASQTEPEGPWRPGLLSVLVELGMEAEARRELSRVAVEGLDAFRQSLWLASLTYLTDACTALGDETIADRVYRELKPLTGPNVIMIGHLIACYGAADRYLGMLAATLGEWKRAEDHFERAMELNRRMGAMTWLAHTAYHYARLLLARGRGERRQAAALLGQAATLAERIGMPTLLDRIRALGSSPTSSVRDPLSPREVQVLTLVARGLSNREIGNTLAISEHTTAGHIRSILRKTGCANRTQAASYAHRRGLVDP